MSRIISFELFVTEVLCWAAWPDPSEFNRKSPVPFGTGAWDEKGK